ncbi:MAG: C25 family cysteine peptidase [Planctomycetota bacterium]|nr:C25 family cysteine peptidase [Planctomycetota bacterium]
MLAIRTALVFVLVSWWSVGYAAAVDVVVVCADGFREALQPWLKYRSDQGYEIRVISSGPTAADVRRDIQRVAAAGKLKAVVLVGDCRVAPDRPATAAVPAAYVRSQAISRFGGEREIATDNGYADLDGDHVPDVAVGRLSADSPDQLATIVRKIIAYETSADFGPWRRRINFVAGVGGFGGLIDGLIEQTTRMFLAGGIPAEYQTSMTHASWTSPYCPDPRKFSSTTVQRLNEGCLFWIYMGHGNPRRLDTLKVPDRKFPILTAADVPRLNCKSPAPVALFISCYAGACDADEDCLAEEMLSHERGPVAVVAGSRMTLPYAMAVLGTELMTECFQHKQPTLGEMLLRAKRRAAVDQPQDRRRQALDSLGRLFSTSSQEMADQRRDHLHLFNLIGDPLLRLHYPQPVQLEVPTTATPGSTIDVQGMAPIAGAATIELVVRRDRLTFTAPQRKQYKPNDQFLSEFDKVYRQANNSQLAVQQITIDKGEFHVALPIPATAAGRCHVRIYIQGQDDCAMGSAAVEVAADGVKVEGRR